MQLQTTINDDHSHIAEIDNEGNGRTITTDPETHSDHMHLIENNIIKEFNEHSHLLVEDPTPSKSVKDEYTVILNTGLQGSIAHDTPLMIGDLNSIIICSEKQINICIQIKGKDITIYKKQGYIGDKYLSIRNDVSYFDGEVAQNFADKWKLNDQLSIMIEGGIESITELTFRLD